MTGLIERILEKLWPRQVVAPAVPFAPFHEVPLTPEEFRLSLRGRRDDHAGRAVFMVLEGQEACAVNDLADGSRYGPGGHHYLTEAMQKLRALVESKDHDSIP